MVTIKFTGTAYKVRKMLKAYFQEYHPCGYGTRIRNRIRNADGTVTVVVERWYTCD